MINKKSYQEFNVVIQEGDYKLTFRVETHSNLDEVFEGVSRTDLIRHANVRLEHYSDGKWSPVLLEGADTKNYHLLLNKVLQNNGY